jgi:hypothetical protein
MPEAAFSSSPELHDAPVARTVVFCLDFSYDQRQYLLSLAVISSGILLASALPSFPTSPSSDLLGYLVFLALIEAGILVLAALTSASWLVADDWRW